MLKVDQLDLASLGAGPVHYEEIACIFLPEQAEVFTMVASKLEKWKRRTTLVGNASDFDKFFDTLIAVKEQRAVLNTALALRTMAELALERLEQLAAESADTPEA
jgi:hypothetical protein